MGKKIVVITGSPRKKGNSNAMAKAFINAAEEKGYKVDRFDAAKMKFTGCRACGGCFKKGRACAQDDDFNDIAPKIEKADAVVFTMPVYWYTIPSQIKGVIDKLYAFFHSDLDITGKKCVLIACCEENDPSVLDGVRVPIERSAALLKWEMAGEVLIPGVNDPGDIEKTDGCRQAAALAEKLFGEEE